MLIPLLLGPGLYGRPPVAQDHPISWSLSTSAKGARQGVAFPVALHAQIPAGWHVYSISQPPGGPVPTTIAPADANFRFAGPPRARDPEVAEDSAFGMIITETY